MVGVGTVLADDPELTCRLPGLGAGAAGAHRGRRPPAHAADRAAAGDRREAVPTWFVAPRRRRRGALPTLRGCGVDLIEVPVSAAAGLDLRRCFRRLGERGLTRVLVEGRREARRRAAATRGWSIGSPGSTRRRSWAATGFRPRHRFGVERSPRRRASHRRARGDDRRGRARNLQTVARLNVHRHHHRHRHRARDTPLAATRHSRRDRRTRVSISAMLDDARRLDRLLRRAA